MRRARTFFQLIGPFGKLLGLHHQQIGAGIDADVLQLRRLLSQRSDLSHVVLKLSMSRRVALFQRLASAGRGAR